MVVQHPLQLDFEATSIQLVSKRDNGFTSFMWRWNTCRTAVNGSSVEPEASECIQLAYRVRGSFFMNEVQYTEHSIENPVNLSIQYIFV